MLGAVPGLGRIPARVLWDFVGRLRRSIDGEIAPDRFYFGDKAHELRDAAQSLVDHVDDIEWWLGRATN